MRCTLNLKEAQKKVKPANRKITSIRLVAFFKDENKKFIYATGESINPNDWDIKKREPTNLTGRTSKADAQRSIKTQLNRYTDFFKHITNIYKSTGQEITIDAIKKQFDNEFKKVARKYTFFEVYDLFTEDKQKNLLWSKATIKRYKNIKNHLLQFEKSRNYRLTFNAINDNFLSEFTDYCMTELGHINNTYSRNLGLVKTFLFWSYKKNHTYRNNFMDFKKKERVITNQIALTLQDLETLLKTQFKTQKLERVRDVFIFSCVTGMRFGELKLISKANIKNDTLFLKEEKEANKQVREIELTPIAMYILKKYDYVLPLIANQKHNEYIKEVFKAAGYTHEVEKASTRGKEVIRKKMLYYERISSHTARRTFITLMKSKGKSDKLIAKMTGHKDMKTLNQYYQVTNKDVRDAVAETFDIEIPLNKAN